MWYICVCVCVYTFCVCIHTHTHTHTHWNIIQSKKWMKSCHLQQHGWSFSRTEVNSIMLREKNKTKKNKCHMSFRKCVLLKKNPKLIDTEKRSVVGRVGGWELREIGKGDFKKIEDYQSYLFSSHIEQSMFLYFGCCSITKLYPTLGDPMDCSTPSFPVLHCLPEFAQTRVHWVDDAIQPSLLSLSPHAFNLSQHEDLLQWGSLYQMSSIGASASVLLMIFRVAFL